MESFNRMQLFCGIKLWRLSQWFAVATLISLCKSLPQAAPPLLKNVPFIFMWTAPTELCKTRYGVDLDLKYFQYVSSTLKTDTNQTVSIFYPDRFGIYPTVNEITGESFNGGLPQLVNLKKHYEQAKKDVHFYIPYNNPGLAVLDLEDWRPQWVRNWAEKDIYRRYSTALVQQRGLTLTFEKAYHVAKDEFEQAATSYFKNSLKLGKTLKHKRVWGYYLFPECYNYDYNQTINYTGRCPDIEIERNNKLQWLWNESTALYPSIYLEIILKASSKALLFVRHRLQEAMRVAMLPNPSYSLPVYAYTQAAFKDNNTEYLSEIDYVHTFGEAVALGVSGIVQWGSQNFTKSMDTCVALRSHIEKTLNPYILNITTATKLCSATLCKNKGRCIRKNWNSSDYLHLNPQSFKIQRAKGGELSVNGKLSQKDVRSLEEKFTCFCFTKEPCNERSILNNFSRGIYNKDFIFSVELVLGLFILTILCGHVMYCNYLIRRF
ncbi:hyaluronidase PH-20-like [Acipenser ruthenus]|uniref:hyaluronidase PH-20-like n=1 Tax=Acipenser ruthenus TaxID=7906 RepID=UPI0027428977|nr:hyaluronidase PH-20-like [Acipenser ruthenus]